MAYIGKEPADSFISFAKQDFSTSATTSYTLDNAVTNENELALFINFVRQEPTTAYTASGTTLTLTSATASSDDMYCVYLGQAKQTVNAPDGSVGSSQVAASIITGQTAETSIATDDTVLIHDTSAGALRKMTRANFVSGIGGTNTPNFRAYQSSSQTVSTGTTTIITLDTENFDSANAFASNTFTVPSGQAGKYFLHFNVGTNTDLNHNQFSAMIYKGSSLIAICRDNAEEPYDMINVSTVENLSAGDTITFRVHQSKGSDITIYNGSEATFGLGYKLIE